MEVGFKETLDTILAKEETVSVAVWVPLSVAAIEAVVCAATA
jgi:hypothetical protein